MNTFLGIVTGTGVVIAVPCLLLLPVFAIPPIRRYYRAQWRIAWEGLRFRRAPVPVSTSADRLVADIRARKAPHDYVKRDHCDRCYLTWERYASRSEDDERREARLEMVGLRADYWQRRLTPVDWAFWMARSAPEPGAAEEPQDGLGRAASTEEDL